ncbi:hypothetical protein BDP27DRAFT_1218387 [Rhodocollybia butyracea]|uniref:FHA domain-containing protein n=1 Tax=Rhodocollybia butyracea TaxID=206335 RepID=A0A9P5PYV2_9AGAR|nr:hypothetical protein BDP27DRAFT_1218387 [Rhodocollybia butyracea]
MLALQAKEDSFPFASKFIPIHPNIRVVLGSQETSSGQTAGSRNATSTNGWFAALPPRNGQGPLVSPIPLSPNHAEIWSRNGQIYVRDLESAFGTYVNGIRVNGTVALKNNDTLCLGAKIVRNANTPAYVTDEHLRPIVAKVTCLGVPSRPNN